MTTYAFTLTDVDAEIEAENKRHKEALAELQIVRNAIMRKHGLNEHSSKQVINSRAALDLASYGAKKRLLLRLISKEQDGLSSHELLAAVQKEGWIDCKLETIVPQLSAYKSADPPLLDRKNGQWTITQRGRDYLANPKK